MKNKETKQISAEPSNVSYFLSLTFNKHERTSIPNSYGQEKKDSDTILKSSIRKNLLHTLDSIGKKLWYIFIEPRLIGEDNKRREFLLNVIISAFLVLLLLLSVLYICNAVDYSPKYKLLSLFFLSLIWATFSSLLLLSRKGYINLASYGLIGLIILFSTSGALEWGFDLPAVIISYLLIIVIAGILFDSKIGIIFTVTLSVMIYLIGYYQIKIKVPNLYWRLESPEIIDTLTYTFELCFIMSISWLSNHEVNKSLKRARASEERLRNELERISRVYHFAEFGKLSSGAFHDLMNPLTSIYLSMNELKNSLHPEIKQTKIFLETAVRASQRMQNFIEALEKQIRPSATIESFSINKEIEQAIELISYKARRANCKIIFAFKENICTYGNSLALYQTVTNLLSNAVDSYEGKMLKNKVIKIILQNDTENIQIVFKDQGNGISPEKINDVFDPFFTTKSLHKGIGLGLSTSKERIEKEFNGNITVSSKLNYGTTFIISIPKIPSSKTDGLIAVANKS